MYASISTSTIVLFFLPQRLGQCGHYIRYKGESYKGERGKMFVVWLLVDNISVMH
jgi:hypothetical protein